MIKAVIFAFEGVIITTNQYHFLAWKKVAEKENIDFSEQLFEKIKDLPRMVALDVLISNAHKKYKEMEKIRLSNLKNTYYLESIQAITSDNILPGVWDIIHFLNSRKIPIAVSSTSRNCKLIITLLQMNNLFQAIVDGNDITRTKPDPEVFEKAARKLGINPKDCLVIEDSIKGIEAAHAADMKSFAIGEANNSMLATYYGNDLIDLKNIII